MKIVVIGCTHAGTAATLNAAKLYPDAEITVYEQNDTISFLSCGIALYVQGVVTDAKGLFYCSPNQLEEQGVTTRMRHTVTKVDLAAKTLEVKNLATGESFADHFDKLIATCGSWPIIPNLPGKDLEAVKLCKNYDHAKNIIEAGKVAKSVVIVGGGYIGIELAEAFADQGKTVTLIDMQDRILSQYFDTDFTNTAQKELEDMGVTFHLNQTVQAFEAAGSAVDVVTDKGRYNADMVVQCIGFRPNTDLFKGQLDMLPNGAIIVDKYIRTSNPDVFAAGDSASIFYNPTGKPGYIPLATNAIRMGTLAAYNLVNPTYEYQGTQSTSAIKIGAYNFSATGLTEVGAEKAGMAVTTTTITSTNRPAFMPTHEGVTLKLVYRTDNKVVVGAQLVSKANAVEIINTLSLAVQNKMTTTQLAFVDQFFQPHYDNPWSIINLAGLSTL